MNVATDEKPTITLDKKANATDTISPSADANQSSNTTPPEKNSSESMRKAIKGLDSERTELVKNTIKNIKPGKPLGLGRCSRDQQVGDEEEPPDRRPLFNSVYKSGPEVQAIVHQIIAI